MANELDITTLNCDAVDAKSRVIDWNEALGENLDGFQCWEAVECEECKRTVVTNVIGEEECQHLEPVITIMEDLDGTNLEEVEADNVCEGIIRNEGPQMNYFYPVKISNLEEAARAIEGLPLCVIELEDGETGLALTGGGMDLSWEICEAYIRLGYLPPFDFCHLPNMAGMKATERNLAIVAACKRSCECIAGWAESRSRGLDRTVEQLKE